MIKSYKKFNAKSKLSKEELDLMSETEIDDYRYNFITKSDFKDPTVKKYLLELEVYKEVRFKDEKFKMFDKWCKKAHENQKNGVKDDALHFNVDMLEREDGYNLMYYLGLSGDIKKAGELEYIKGIDISMPEKYQDMFKFNF